MAALTNAQKLVPNTKNIMTSLSREGYATWTTKLAVPAAGTYYVSLAGLIRPGQLNLGIAIQPFGMSVTPSLSLADFEDVSANPASVPWMAQAAVASNNIGNLGLIYGSSLRLVASGAGTVYVAAL